jgi:hypothetical protein
LRHPGRIIAAIVSSKRIAVVADFLAQLMLALLQALAELLCYFTSRFLLPVFSVGATRWLISCRRLPNGTIGVGGDPAVLIALIFWIVVIVGGVLMLHAWSS